MSDTSIHLHLVSDSTGETLSVITRACLAQFENIDYHEHTWSLVRSQRQLAMVMDGILRFPGLVLFTFVDDNLGLCLSRFCEEKGMASLSVLSPILSVMGNYFGKPSIHKPGQQHILDADYFKRIDAMDFTLALDDGHKTELIEEADVVLLGISRTSKTPTCVYLAHRGIRAANIPLIPDIPIDIDFKNLKKPLVVGLIKDPESLAAIRKTRLKNQDYNVDTHYTDLEKITEEIKMARRLFSQIKCPVIDVSRRSIEETAAEILNLLNKRNQDRLNSATKGVF